VYGTRDELDEALAEVQRAGGGPVRWFVTDPTDADIAAAAAHDLTPERRILQLQRPLPVGLPYPPIALRSFVPGQDERAWVEVNNRSFASHPEQGGWSEADVLAREAEPWFDPEGFLLHHDEATGALAGFVWTKVHADVTPSLGEIFVIGVDPHFQGRRLGRSLTLAGLDWLNRERGIEHGMLFVDGANETAIAMYTKLDFHLDHTDHAFAGVV
jgi:mycothiol synthase